MKTANDYVEEIEAASRTGEPMTDEQGLTDEQGHTIVLDGAPARPLALVDTSGEVLPPTPEPAPTRVELFTPRAGYVLIALEGGQEKTEGGILLPNAMQEDEKQTLLRGIIVEVGDEQTWKAEVEPFPYAQGAYVSVRKWGAMDLDKPNTPAHRRSGCVLCEFRDVLVEITYKKLEEPTDEETNEDPRDA